MAPFKSDGVQETERLEFLSTFHRSRPQEVSKSETSTENEQPSAFQWIFFCFMFRTQINTGAHGLFNGWIARPTGATLCLLQFWHFVLGPVYCITKFKSVLKRILLQNVIDYGEQYYYDT